MAWLCLVPFLAFCCLPRGADAELSVDDYNLIGEALHATEMDEWPRAFRLMTTIQDPLAIRLFHWLHMVERPKDISFDRLARFIIENPTWPRIEDLQTSAESKLTDFADKELTIALFERNAPLTTRGRIRYAEALFDRGRSDDAVRQVRTAWSEGNFSTQEEQRFLTRHRQHLNLNDHNVRLDNLLWEREWRQAKRMLERVSVDRKKLGVARLALQTQSPGVDGAINAVPDDLQNDPGLLYDRIRWRRLKRLHDGAKALLLNPPQQLGRPDRWWFERSYQIRRAIDDRQFEEAYRLAGKHGQLKGRAYAEAEWLAGWLALRFTKRPKTAFRHFVRLYDRVKPPVRQARAAYWAGRAAASQGDEAGAVAWYRRGAAHGASYYGQLARAEIDDEDIVDGGVEPTDAERAAFEANELAEVARLLIAVGDQRLLEDFLGQLADDAETGAEIGLIADYANAAGLPTLVARLGRAAAFDGKVYEKASFPIPTIQGLLQPKAAVEPSLLLSVARQESMFRSGASSHAGARGLLQLIPSTARIVARNVGATYDPDRLIADHDYNALLGGHYLQSLIERFDGEVALALAGYNAGPLRVKQWIERHGDPRAGDDDDLIDWIELIPFQETRNYVQRVLEGYGVYQRRLSEANLELIDYPGFNLLHPPPIPTFRPDNLEADLTTVKPRDLSAADIPRPRLKPLDRERVLADGRLDGGQDRQPAAEEAHALNDEPPSATAPAL